MTTSTRLPDKDSKRSFSVLNACTGGLDVEDDIERVNASFRGLGFIGEYA